MQAGPKVLAPDDPRIRELTRMLREAQGIGDRLSDRYFDILRLFNGVMRSCAGTGATILGAQPPAVAVARTLLIDDRLDGEWFSFDGRPAFQLPSRLAALLVYLASASPDRDAGERLVGFRKRADILGYLEMISGKRIRPQYLNHMVALLKKRLRGLDGRFLILSGKSTGVRLLLEAGGLRRTQSRRTE